MIELTSRRNTEIIDDELSKLKIAKGDVNINNFWKLKPRIFPQARDASAAKYDSKGHLVTSGGKLKDLYLQTYQERLKHRKIKEDLEKHRKNEAKDKIKNHGQWNSC